MSELNKKIAEIRVKLQNSNIKKSGKNKHAGFDYYELGDFLPVLNALHKEHKINDQFTIKDGLACLILRMEDESQEYSMPFEMFKVPENFKKDKGGNFIKDHEDKFVTTPMMQQIQYLGALNTYYKRYLYMNAYGITDGEVLDGSEMKPVWWDLAVDWLQNKGGTIDQIAKKYSISNEQKEALMQEAAGG